MQPLSRSRRVWLFGAFFAVASCVYATRAFRTLAVGGDSAELVTAAAVWGVAHSPGYSLFATIGHIFSGLPWFEIPFRVHLTSALFHAAAVGFAACAIEVVTGSVEAAVIDASTLALGRVFFMGSLYAEVFPLNDLLFTALVWLGVGIAARERDPVPRAPPWRTVAVVVGFGLAHHPLFILSLPALGLLIGRPLARELRERPHRALELAGLALVPVVASYGLVPWMASRNPYISWGDARDVGSLFRLATRHDYGGPFRASRAAAHGQLLERLDVLAAATGASFGPIGTLLALAGAASRWKGERRIAIALVLAAFFTGPLFFAANAIDIHSDYRVAYLERFGSMCQVPVAILCGLGAARVIAWFRSRAPWPGRTVPRRSRFPRSSRVVQWLGVATLTAVTLGPLAPNLARLDMSRDRLGMAYAHDLVLPTPDGSLLLLKGDMPSQASLYVCGVEQRCGRRIVISPGQLFMPWRTRQLSLRYPELSLSSETGDPISARRLVEQELDRRAVFVNAELLDDALSGEKTALPWGLLFRIYPDEPSLRADLPSFRQNLEAMAGRKPSDRPFEGVAHPLDRQAVQAYEAALLARRIAARELGVEQEGETLRARPYW